MDLRCYSLSPSDVEMFRSKSVPSPSREMVMISRFTSNTDREEPSNVIAVVAFCDLNLKKMDDDMVARCRLCATDTCGSTEYSPMILLLIHWAGLAASHSRNASRARDRRCRRVMFE